jgi:hypothetical protein
LTQNKVDLADVANTHPVNQKTAVLDLNAFDASQLTLLEVLDMADTVGIETAELGAVMKGGSTSKRMRLMYAMAWCIARRAEPSLTFEQVCSWKLEVIGEVDATKAERAAKRAAVIVGAASVSGLPPSEAGNLTVAELGAYRDRQARTNRAQRRSRKAG